MLLRDEARELAARYCEESFPVKEIARMFGVSTSTIYRLKKRKEETGSVALRLNTRGRKSQLTATDLAAIDEQLRLHPDTTIAEIKETLKLAVCVETVRKAVICLGYHIQKRTVHATERKGFRYVRTAEEAAHIEEGTEAKR